MTPPKDFICRGPGGIVCVTERRLGSDACNFLIIIINSELTFRNTPQRLTFSEDSWIWRESGSTSRKKTPFCCVFRDKGQGQRSYFSRRTKTCFLVRCFLREGARVLVIRTKLIFGVLFSALRGTGSIFGICFPKEKPFFSDA